MKIFQFESHLDHIPHVEANQHLAWEGGLVATSTRSHSTSAFLLACRNFGSFRNRGDVEVSSVVVTHAGLQSVLRAAIQDFRLAGSGQPERNARDCQAGHKSGG